MKALAYTVFWDMKHVKGERYDAALIPFERWDHLLAWHTTDAYEAPASICFEADFSITRHSDYPANDVGWPLMSARMIEVLRRVREFPHRSVPVRFVDRDVPDPGRRLPDGTLKPEVVDDRFAAVQLLEHTDVVDWEGSEFRRSRIDPNSVATFYKLLLVEPPGGLPPLFRIPAKASLLFVSAAAYQALQASGIRGATFEPVYGAGE